MNRPPIARQVILTLIVTTVLLPIAMSVLLGMAALLAGMGDAVGGGVFQRVALAVGVLWVINLIALVLAQAINGVGVQTREDRDDSAEP